MRKVKNKKNVKVLIIGVITSVSLWYIWKWVIEGIKSLQGIY